MEVILTGSEVTVRYQEPTTNKDGSPLVDMDHTSIYSKVGDLTEKVGDQPASSINGGGSIEFKFIANVGADQEANVDVWATAFDLAGNESDPSPVNTVRIDHLPPAAPL